MLPVIVLAGILDCGETVHQHLRNNVDRNLSVCMAQNLVYMTVNICTNFS
ncbi:hypothetical protein COCNU_07G007230 [Cocos nucifera]|uniref:Uncharacterized protein n=1 Tax=Cocos nucifera TaxID=13894 RepID=A0A8K0IF05_COCNU|nr:hypothetical protein COCNU_07G007230 [Cocos nucifera]